MIDIHTHIMYNIDDGAKCIEDSIELIHLEIENDVDNIVLTPHFDPYYDSLEKFIEKRAKNYAALVEKIKSINENVSLYTGSEVFYSKILQYYDTLKPLCFFNEKYLLIEFSPNHVFDNKFFGDFLNIIEKFDVIPIIAHVEVYRHIRRRYKLINNLRELGCIIQVNADSVLNEVNDKFMRTIFKRELVDIIASDCHDKIKRPPRLKQAMELIKKNYGEAYFNKIVGNENIINK
jgi:Capsular polysaccharide biosynthesis protein